MLKVTLAALFVLPSLALAAPAASVINEVVVQENAAKGEQRICVKVYALDSANHCSKSTPKPNARIGEILAMHRAAGMKLPFKTMALSNYTVDALYDAIQAAKPAAKAPPATAIETKALATEETTGTPDVCKATGSTLLQETLKKATGEAYVQRSLLLTDLQFPGSTRINKPQKLPMVTNEGGNVTYKKTTNYASDSSQQISVSAVAPSTLFEGSYWPTSVTVTISKDSGELVKTYTCRLQNTKPPVDVEIPAVATGVN